MLLVTLGRRGLFPALVLFGMCISELWEDLDDSNQ